MADLNRIVHERARLLILTYLASSKNKICSFNDLLKKLDFTSGNLSIQLKKLKETSYINIEKTFKDNKPFTTVSITPEGKDALNLYVQEMERIIQSMKG